MRKYTPREDNGFGSKGGKDGNNRRSFEPKEKPEGCTSVFIGA